MTIWHRKFTSDIDSRLTAPALRALFAAWEQAGDPSSGPEKPPLSGFMPEDWPALKHNLMLLQSVAGDYVYRHYGGAIARTAGFDMVGRRVSDFGGELAQYFMGCYRDTDASGKPLYAVHYSDRTPTVFSWERLVLPLRDDQGCTWLLVHNVPLEDRHTLLERVLNASSDAVLALRAQRAEDGQQSGWSVVTINDRFVQLVGKAVPNPLGRRVSEALLRWVDLGLERQCQTVLARGERVSFDTIIQVRGEPHEYAGEAVPLDDGCVLRLSDVTEARRHQRALAQRESELRLANERLLEANALAESADRAKSAFLAAMSHEMRTPMNGVVGMAQLLALGDLKPQEAEKVQILQRSAQSLLAVIDDVLDFSKIEAGHVVLQDQVVAVAELAAEVHDALLPIAQARDVQLRVQAAQGDAAVWGDAGRVRQVLMNLVTNAIKFSAGRPLQPGRVDVVLQADADGLHLKVVDNGIGMDSAVQAHLFQAFMQGEAQSTRRYGGAGLGLAICQRLVTLMRGRISVDSTAGQGSTFRVHLPLRSVNEPSLPDAGLPAEAPPLPAAPAALAFPTGDAFVLVAEDDPVNQLLVGEQLRMMGYRFEVTSNGREALDRWRQQKHDLLLTDLHMPELDGYGLVSALRAEAAERRRLPPPIVMLTANAVHGEADRAHALGVDRFLVKPVKIEVLGETLAECLRLHRKVRDGVA